MAWTQSLIVHNIIEDICTFLKNISVVLLTKAILKKMLIKTKEII